MDLYHKLFLSYPKLFFSYPTNCSLSYPTNCSPSTLQTVPLPPYKLFSFYPTNCSPLTLKFVLIIPFKLFSSYSTICSHNTLQTVLLPPYKLFSFYPTNCFPSMSWASKRPELIKLNRKICKNPSLLDYSNKKIEKCKLAELYISFF